MRGLPEYRIRAADSISPPLASAQCLAQFPQGFCSSPSALGRPPLDSGCWILESVGGWVCVRRALGGLRPPWILDPGICGRLGWVCVRAPGFWMLESVGGWAVCGPPGFWILDAGICGRLGGVRVRAARILDSGFWKLGCRRVCGCGPPGFWILDSGNWAVGGSRGEGRPDSGFWILDSAATCACDAYAWEQRWHMSGCWILDSGNWAVEARGVGRPDSGFCILHSATCICM